IRTQDAKVAEDVVVVLRAIRTDQPLNLRGCLPVEGANIELCIGSQEGCPIPHIEALKIIDQVDSLGLKAPGKGDNAQQGDCNFRVIFHICIFLSSL
ncbi:MAG: hypothetical protein EBT07_16915, partial [Actinobacteria bacterium]|nr:hypothetical protein [Actinomycetota bacterium]